MVLTEEEGPFVIQKQIMYAHHCHVSNVESGLPSVGHMQTFLHEWRDRIYPFVLS